MKSWHTGRDNTENTESRLAPGRLRSTRRHLEETPCKRVKGRRHQFPLPMYYTMTENEVFLLYVD